MQSIFGTSCFEMKLWLIFTHPRERLVGMLLSSAPLWWGMRGDRKREMKEKWEGDGEGGGDQRWSGVGRAEPEPVVILRAACGCQRPCNPPPPLPSILSLSSPPPHHDKPDLLSIKEPQATSLLFPPFLPSSPHPICHLLCLCLGQLVGTGCRCQAWPLSSRSWHGGATSSPQWQHLESHLMGLGAFANLSTSFGYGARCQAGWSGRHHYWSTISGAMGEIQFKGLCLLDHLCVGT